MVIATRTLRYRGRSASRGAADLTVVCAGLFERARGDQLLSWLKGPEDVRWCRPRPCNCSTAAIHADAASRTTSSESPCHPDLRTDLGAARAGISLPRMAGCTHALPETSDDGSAVPVIAGPPPDARSGRPGRDDDALRATCAAGVAVDARFRITVAGGQHRRCRDVRAARFSAGTGHARAGTHAVVVGALAATALGSVGVARPIVGRPTAGDRPVEIGDHRRRAQTVDAGTPWWPVSDTGPGRSCR